MDRRRFLGLLGIGGASLALGEAIPLGRVWSFPKQLVIAQPVTVRFIKVWEPLQRKVMHRFEVLYSFRSAIPSGTHNESFSSIEIPRESCVADAVKMLAERHEVFAPPVDLLRRHHAISEPSWSYATTRPLQEYFPTAIELHGYDRPTPAALSGS